MLYTLESFQKHLGIDEIEVVCLNGWLDFVKAYCNQFNITKLKYLTIGGKTGQESIRNGVYNLEEHCDKEDIIVIHDGVRPLVENYVLTDVIEKCKKFGNAVTSMPYNEQIFLTTDGETTTKYIPRETLRRVSTPQAYKYGELLGAYKKAFAEKNIKR